MTKRKKSFQFEQSMSELERIVEALEAGEMSLDESLKQFERGVKLTQDCTSALKQAELSIKKLTKDNDKFTLGDLDPAYDEDDEA